jgi:hypothetical protein
MDRRIEGKPSLQSRLPSDIPDMEPGPRGLISVLAIHDGSANEDSIKEAKVIPQRKTEFA